MRNLYKDSLALLTDLYQLTMAYAYWRNSRHSDEAVFHLFFRRAPFGDRHALACGLGPVIDYLADFRFDRSDLDYLSTLGLFDDPFVEYLANLKLQCDVDAVPEGTVVFAHQPLVRVRGPILQCQILETALLNQINFQTLVATKAARVVAATGGDPVLEFGLRRAQGIDGGVSATRAAYVGGCAATSNVLAGKLFGIPVKGTHAHSWVMCFESELEAFEAYANALPNNCVFLVDTYDTLEGVKHAIEVATSLRKRGHETIGVRLDSGDLGTLSIETRRLLDSAGFPDVAIVASNDLDEESITELKSRGAAICVWGVGTRLATAYDQPALDGVYKLSAFRKSGGDAWRYTIKRSEEAEKSSLPGILQVRRFSVEGRPVADVVFDEELGCPDKPTFVPNDNPKAPQSVPEGAAAKDLLEPVFRAGRCVLEPPSLDAIRARAQKELAAVAQQVGVESQLHELRQRLLLNDRRSPPKGSV